MTNTATRLITLVMLLQRQPNQTASQLAQALDVSPRTVQRYISMLEEIGIPIYAERGPYGGYALVRGYKMPPLVFTPEEAVAIYLGTSLLEQVWGRLYQDAGRGTLAKLDNVLPDEQRREVAWARQTLPAMGMHQADPALTWRNYGRLFTSGGRSGCYTGARIGAGQLSTGTLTMWPQHSKNCSRWGRRSTNRSPPGAQQASSPLPWSTPLETSWALCTTLTTWRFWERPEKRNG